MRLITFQDSPYFTSSNLGDTQWVICLKPALGRMTLLHSWLYQCAYLQEDLVAKSVRSDDLLAIPKQDETVVKVWPTHEEGLELTSSDWSSISCMAFYFDLFIVLSATYRPEEPQGNSGIARQWLNCLTTSSPKERYWKRWEVTLFLIDVMQLHDDFTCRTDPSSNAPVNPVLKSPY